MTRPSSGNNSSPETFPEDEESGRDFLQESQANVVVASLPERVSESQIASVRRTPVATPSDSLLASEEQACPRCTSNPPEPTETACRFLVIQLIVHLALLIVVGSVLSLVGCIITVVGAAIPVCCMMNKRGWQFYLITQALALLFFLTDIVLYLLYANAILLLPSIGVLSAIVGLLSGVGAMQYFTLSEPVSVEVQMHTDPKPMLATTISSPEAESAESQDFESYMVGVVPAYAADD